MTGQARCRFHGGASPQALAAAERRIAEAEARALVSRLLHNPDAPPVDDPLTELQRVAGRMGHAVDVLGERVNALAEVDYADANLVRRAHVAVDAWKDLTIEYRKTLSEMVRLDIDGRVVKLAEDQTRAVAVALVAALGTLELTVEQRVAAQQVFLGSLRSQVVVDEIEPLPTPQIVSIS